MAAATMTTLANVKDSRWLQLEVCREFQRNKCTRPDTECKFAHPASNVEVQNGRVIACYDSIKGRCNREKPPCKYFHPPQHLKDQLLINGRNHLALKNALLQQMPLQAAAAATMLQPTPANPAQAAAAAATMAANPYMPTLMAPPYLTGLLPGVMAATAAEPATLMTPTTLISPQKRTDRLEVCREYQRGSCKRAEHECRFAHPPEHVGVESSPSQPAAAGGGGGACDVTVCMDFVKGRCAREQCRYFHPPAHLQAQLKARDQNTLQQTPDSSGLSQHPSPVPVSSVPSMPSSMPGLSLSPMSMAAMGGYPAAHASLSPQQQQQQQQHTVAQIAQTRQTAAGSPYTTQAFNAQLMAQAQAAAAVAAAAAAAAAASGGPAITPPVAAATYATPEAAASNGAPAAPAAADQSASHSAAASGHPQAKKRARDAADSDLLHLATLQGMVQYKRPALEKSGLPVYQPAATAAAAAAYQQAALALQMQQPFAVPVSYYRYSSDVYRFS